MRQWTPGSLTGIVLAVVGISVLAGLGLTQIRPVHSDDNLAPAAARIENKSAQRLPATSAPVVRPRHEDPFAADARSYLTSRLGAVQAAVYDVDSGQTWSIGQTAPQATASIVKLDILEALLVQRRLSGTGLSPSEDLLAREMIEDSDNLAATTLWDAAGGAAGIGKFNTTAGLTGTTPSPCVNCAGFPWPGWGLTTTTATDQITLLRELVEPSALLTQPERGYILGLMENVLPAQRWGISGGVPDGATVAVKDGWLPLNNSDTDWQVNSIGWVSGYGRNYLIAVLTTGSPAEQYGIDTVSLLSAHVWQAMG